MDGRRELLLFNTTRAHTPEDPQAQEPLSKEGAAAVQHNAQSKQASKHVACSTASVRSDSASVSPP